MSLKPWCFLNTYKNKLLAYARAYLILESTTRKAATLTSRRKAGPVSGERREWRTTCGNLQVGNRNDLDHNWRALRPC